MAPMGKVTHAHFLHGKPCLVALQLPSPSLLPTTSGVLELADTCLACESELLNFLSTVRATEP